MSFFKNLGRLETIKQEQARLAQSPAGSIYHHLSTLPITIPEWPEDLLIELPWAPPRSAQQFHVIVVPIRFHPEIHPTDEEKDQPHKRHSGSWDCAVVSSDHDSYPVGGHRLSIATVELSRGRKINLAELIAAAAANVPF